MKLTDYQEQASQTAAYPREHRIAYLALGLTSEAGEVAGKYKKVLRDQDGLITENDLDALSLELGDVLWYVSQLATELGLCLHDIAEDNLIKLRSRKARGTIQGSGDSR